MLHITEPHVPEPRSRRRPPEVVAALVNGALIAGLPLLLTIWGALFSTTMAVRPSAWHHLRAAIVGVVIFTVLLTPFALVAVWRTYVHARRYRETGRLSWRGVLEGGLLGVIGVALTVGRAVVTNIATGGGPPGATWLQAFGYIGAYMLIFGGVGAAVGLVMQLSAMFVLRLRA